MDLKVSEHIRILAKVLSRRKSKFPKVQCFRLIIYSRLSTSFLNHHPLCLFSRLKTSSLTKYMVVNIVIMILNREIDMINIALVLLSAQTSSDFDVILGSSSTIKPYYHPHWIWNSCDHIFEAFANHITFNKLHFCFANFARKDQSPLFFRFRYITSAAVHYIQGVGTIWFPTVILSKRLHLGKILIKI